MKIIPLVQLLILAHYAHLFTSFCKCQCPDSYKITPITKKLLDSTKGSFDTDCSICTTEFCLKNGGCSKASDTDTVVATCFQRGSVKDQLIVYGFVLVVLGLITFKLISPYIGK